MIIGENPDQSPDQDEDEAVIIVSEIGVAKEIVNPKATYYVGDMVRYKITVRNNTSATETNVRIGEKLPDALRYVSHTINVPAGATATYTQNTGILHIPSLPGNGTVELFIDAQLVKNGRVENIVRIINKDINPDKPADPKDDYKDSDPDNDEDKEVIEDVKCQPLTVDLTSSATVHCASLQGLTITATEVVGATYTWTLPTGWVITSGAGTNRIVVTPSAVAGEQQVRVSVKNQCNVVVASAPLAINITGAPLAPVINGDNSVCYNTTAGTVLTTPEVEGYTYKWEVTGQLAIKEGQANNSATVTIMPEAGAPLSGTVKLTVRNSCGFESFTVKPMTITTAPGKPTAITGDINLCVSRQATFSTTAVVGATSYAWTFPSDWSVVGADNGRTITVTVGEESGDVSVRAVNACGPGEAVSKPVTVVPQPTLANFTLTSSANALCEGQTLELTATQVPNAKGYVFAVNGGLQVVSTQGNKVTVRAGSTGGTVSVTITDFCDRPLTVNKDIAVTPKLTAVDITGAAQVCRNSTGNPYTASAYDVPVTYEWTATGVTITSGANARTVQVSAGIAGGSLTVKVSNENGCFTVTKTYLINTITPPALPTLITGNNDVCEGNTLTYSVPNVAGVTYTWAAPAGWSIAGANNNASVSMTVGAASGRIVLMAADACGNTTELGLDVTVTRLPVAPGIAGPATACAGEEVTYTLSGAASNITYTWAVTGWTIKGANTGNSITVVAGSGAGNITVTAASTKCGSVNSSMAVGITPKPTRPGSISHDVNVCQSTAGNVISVAEVPGATSYLWNLPLGWVITAGEGTNRITVTVNTAGGLVSVRANNCTGASDATTTNIDLTLPPAPVTRIIDNSNVCDGLVYTAELVNGATAYTWTVPQGFTIESGQGTPTIRVKASNPNAVGQVSVIASTGGCVGSAEYSMNIDATLADGQLDFPKAFSPNGDGKNDTWLVKNLEKFPDNEMVIFNRWGAEVYKQRNYKNNWSAQGLGQGTYFYKVQVKLCDGKYQEYSGYVTIFR